VKISSCLDELQKLGAISDEQASQAADRLEALEQSGVTARQAGRYALIGAAAGPAVTAVGRLVAGRSSTGAGAWRGTRDAAESAVKGALTGGAVPLLRKHVDQKTEEVKLKKYLRQE
jgi:hypothetical protein